MAMKARMTLADDGAAGAFVAVDEVLQRQIACQQVAALQRVEEFLFDFAIHLDAVFLNAVVRGDTDGLALRAQSDGAGVAFGEGFGQQTADGLGLYLVLEQHNEVATAREVDALAEAAGQHEADADDCQRAEDKEALLVGTHKLIGRILERNLVANGCAEGEAKPLVLLHDLRIDNACQEHSGEEADADTDEQRGGEAADRTCAEVVEDDSRDD